MHVTVISPEAAIFDGEAESVTAPAFDGSVGVLPRHAPLMTLLGQGELAVRQGSSLRRFQVSGGFLQVVHDRVRVVAERVQEISTDA
ncbi:MAG TPA: ATP synthase F1 subunit epsilon [Gemmatimonadales bacterium]|jgi:F-type H+-transporting ATPase subunit epsilon|nr:ATP synthase F1 subunit epsilon [Gemmatimonadales bacterium]